MERVSHRKDVFPATVAYLGTSGFRPVDVRAELTRKSLHLLIAFTPAIALVGLSLAVFSLAAGILAYTFMERLRLSGVRVPVISALTSLSCRERDVGRFVLGPVTLGCGALLALLLFPLQAASVGIFA
ncbi:MAG: hypothetical protein FWD94_03375, partial [Treponema sp.]|nr:hypothetical protein [Treponema sp.]